MKIVALLGVALSLLPALTQVACQRAPSEPGASSGAGSGPSKRTSPAASPGLPSAGSAAATIPIVEPPVTQELAEGSPTSAGAPLSLTSSDGTGLRIVSFKARAVVEDPLAFTELHLTFRNPEARQIEGQFEITLPPGATVSRFAMKQASGWQEGEVVEKRAAQRAYEDFLHRRQDPALLEKQAGNQFRARVFPIPPSGDKELILSYSQELPRAGDPYRLHLRGLPQLDALDIRVIVGKREVVTQASSSLGGSTIAHEAIEVRKQSFLPDRDFILPLATAGLPLEQRRLGLRHANLVVARITPITGEEKDPIGSLLVLFDTSASRAPGFAAQVERLSALLAQLRRELGEATRVRLAAYDQTVEEIYSGSLGQVTQAVLGKLTERRALGASDLGRALTFARTLAAKGGAQRLLLVTDGIVTAGPTEAGKLRPLVAALGTAGVERLDVLVDGGIRDEALLKQLVTAGLKRDGVVIDAAGTPATASRKLLGATFSGIKVSVPESAWVWPTELSGVQPGDEVLIYADLPRDRSFEAVLDGAKASKHPITLALAERPLLERAWINARIQKLMAQRETLGASDPDLRAALKKQVIELSTRFRVLSDFTSLLVLETEADYARFNIDRQALTDIMIVGAGGIDLLNRRQPALPAGSAASGPTRGAVSATETRKSPSAASIEKPREKLEEGKMGKATTRSREGLYALKGPRDPGPMAVPKPAPSAPSGAARAVAQESGVLGALGRDANQALGGLTGSEIGESYGSGGLGLSGTGRGGGGIGEGTIGLGRLGTVGHGGGGGSSSGFGRGSGALARRRSEVVSSGNATVQGSLDRDIIRRVVRRHLNEVRFCYERALVARPNLRGNVSVRFQIDLAGSVPSSSISSSTLGDNAVEQCVVSAVRRWSFPRPGGSVVNVTYPFVFNPSGVSAPDSSRREMAEKQAPPTAPYQGKLLEVMNLVAAKKGAQALALAQSWRDREPGDVLALIALGESYELLGQTAQAARAYGSLIDLFPGRADTRRFAGQRLERLSGAAGLELAVDTYEKARDQRPDHPASHRLLAYALVKQNQPEAAFEAILKGQARSYPPGRFAGVPRILAEDVGLIAAAWIKREPARREAILERLKNAGLTLPVTPSLRFVLNWETDANDVDFHIRDGKGGHAYYSHKALASGGELYADVTTGYGPECFTIPGKAPAYPYQLQAHYFSRGPMGYGMGKLQIIEHDGAGGLRFEERPFVVMVDRAYVDLGQVRAPLK